jgi:TM2 domain-containing membrane protein YozV
MACLGFVAQVRQTGNLVFVVNFVFACLVMSVVWMLAWLEGINQPGSGDLCGQYAA